MYTSQNTRVRINPALVLVKWHSSVWKERNSMNNLSNEALREHKTQSLNPIPKQALYILFILFLIGLSVSTFILGVVHNATFFLCFIFVSALVGSFLFWNTLNLRYKDSIFCFIQTFPDSELSSTPNEQLIKISGVVSCGTVTLESSYERCSRCVYASTSLYEFGWFKWSVKHCERFSTDFYVTDRKSGIRAMVKAGSGCRVVPLIVESKLVATTRQCRVLSPYFRKWLDDRNLSTEPRILRLEEGYVQEGSFVTVIGMLQRSSDLLMIVEPPEILSVGCLWGKMFLPVDIDGLVLANEVTTRK